MAAAAADALGLDHVHFVPTREQPFKVGRHGASARDRAAMLALALEGEPRFELDRRELDRGGPSYTVDTLESLRVAFPGDPLFLLVGADAARELPAWHRAARLAELATVVALTRPGSPPPQHELITRIVAVPAVDVSATEIRERVARGESVAGLVAGAVAAYIAEHGLYTGKT